jgi:hypothetical protein
MSSLAFLVPVSLDPGPSHDVLAPLAVGALVMARVVLILAVNRSRRQRAKQPARDEPGGMLVV